MSSRDLEPFQYEALEPGQIRVLFIWWTMSSDDLVCGIYHTLPSQIDYTAVSYAWESASDTSIMDIPLIDVLEVEHGDGLTGLAFTDQPRRFLPIKESMWKMLLSVGMIGDDDGLEGQHDRVLATAFWIDQICINQSNNAEKSDQVKRMHEIYAEAETTIIYLGEPTEETNIAFEAARALAALDGLEDDEIPYAGEHPFGGKRLDWEAINTIPTYTPQYFEFKSGTQRSNPFRHFAMDILGRRWFDRTWVIQEIVCSREAEIKIGKFKISWESCLAACRVASKIGLAARITINSNAQEVQRLEELRQHYRIVRDTIARDRDNDGFKLRLFKSAVFRSIPHILPKAMYKGVTDPRDKVFALFNIASEASLNALREKFSSLVDYDLPIHTVYIRACELWHSSTPFDISLPGEISRELSFLDWVLDTTQNDNINLPSWVPNWMQKSPTALVRAVGCMAAVNQEENTPKPRVIFPSPDQYLINEAPLIVRGITLFLIHQACMAARRHEAFSEHADAISKFSDPYLTTNLSCLQAYRTAIAPEDSEFGCWSARTCTFWDFVKGTPGGTYNETPREQPPITEKDISSEVLMSVAMISLGYNQYLTNRRSLFLSVNGFMGLAPKDAREGDEVVLLFGGRSPYVVRKILPSGRYKFISACFPLGIMGGEAFRGCSQDKIEDFVLI
jgi:hypothetical protein